MATIGDATDLDALRLAGTIALLSRVIDGEIRHASTDGLSMAEVSVLGQIDRGKNLPSAIARALRLDPGRVTRITDELVSAGYISRQVDPDDRRRCLLCLTEAGRTRITVARSAISTAISRRLDGLAPQERHTLIESLERVRLLLDEPSK